MLTSRQRDLLDFIRQHVAVTGGVAPTYEEMRTALGLRSKSGIHRMVCTLEERGFIRRLPYRSRAVEIIGDNRMRAMQERIMGLEEDLRSAVAVAWRHGARAWVEANYPAMASRLRAMELETA